MEDKTSMSLWGALGGGRKDRRIDAQKSNMVSLQDPRMDYRAEPVAL